MTKIIQRTNAVEVTDMTQTWGKVVNEQIKKGEKGDLTKYFQLGDSDNIIWGFKAQFNEYLELVNSVGTQTFKVRFGINSKGKFVLIVWGIDKNGNNTTNFLVLNQSDVIKKGDSEKDIHIAKILGRTRIKAWKRLERVPPHMFHIEQYQEGLQGYNYQINDFYNTLDSLSPKVKNPSKDVSVHFHFARLDFAFNSEEKPQNSYFDLVISSVATIAEDSKTATATATVGYSFYDAAFPCPPFCSND